MTTNPRDRSLRALRTDWGTLSAPSLAEVEGDFAASFTGRALAAIAPAGLSVAGLPRWYGKRFRADQPDREVLSGINLVAARGDGTLTGDRLGDRDLAETLPMVATVGPSLTDGKPAVVVTYPAGSPVPWRWVRDEVRQWSGDTFLAMTFVDLPGVRRLGGTPFVLTRVSRSRDASGNGPGSAVD